MDNARQVAQTGEYDIDQQVAATAPLEEHADGGREDGEDDFADVAVFVVGDVSNQSDGGGRRRGGSGLESHLAVNAILDDIYRDGE